MNTYYSKIFLPQDWCIQKYLKKNEDVCTYLIYY